MSYNEIQGIIENDEEIISNVGFDKEKLNMVKLYKKLTNILLKRRQKNGYIGFDMPEVQIILDENGKQQVIQMGCYGIGVSRLMSAVIEQKHDDFGIIWPKSIAPYIADVIIANVKDETQVNVAERIYEALKNENIDVVLDDRNERAGFKFKDADLIGFPLKIVAGKGAANGIVEVKDRATGESVEVKVEEVVNFVKEFLVK